LQAFEDANEKPEGIEDEEFGRKEKSKEDGGELARDREFPYYG